MEREGCTQMKERVVGMITWKFYILLKEKYKFKGQINVTLIIEVLQMMPVSIGDNAWHTNVLWCATFVHWCHALESIHINCSKFSFWKSNKCTWVLIYEWESTKVALWENKFFKCALFM